MRRIYLEGPDSADLRLRQEPDDEEDEDEDGGEEDDEDDGEDDGYSE